MLTVVYSVVSVTSEKEQETKDKVKDLAHLRHVYYTFERKQLENHVEQFLRYIHKWISIAILQSTVYPQKLFAELENEHMTVYSIPKKWSHSELGGRGSQYVLSLCFYRRDRHQPLLSMRQVEYVLSKALFFHLLWIIVLKKYDCVKYVL
jgi:hypothetical protein